MYLKVDGVTGESADVNHKGWIDILAFSWDADQSGSMSSGGGGGSGKVSFTDLKITSCLDRASTGIFKFCAAGNHISEVKISICKAGGTQIEYATIVLMDAMVTDASYLGANGGENVNVRYAFQASQVEFHYWTQLETGGRGAESQMGWDVKANRSTL